MNPVTRTLIYAAAAGLAVLVATTLARRAGGHAGGILAASPITPTLSLYYLGDDAAAGFLLPGIATVAGALIGIMVMQLIPPSGGRAGFWLTWMLVPVAALPFRDTDPSALVLLCVTLAVACHVVIAVRQQRRASRGPLGQPSGEASGVSRSGQMPAWARFGAGAIGIMLVAAVAALVPSAAPLAAMAPVVLLAGLAAGFLDGGHRRALGISHGAIAGAMGVLAFAATHTATGTLVPAWFAFLVTAALWRVAAARLDNRTLRPPVPQDGLGLHPMPVAPALAAAFVSSPCLTPASPGDE